MNNHGFPEFPPFEAEWVPIYVELIPCSGERLTIGVAAWGKGEFKHALAITGTHADILLGEAATLIHENFYRTCEVLEGNISTSCPTPLKGTCLGLFVGYPRKALGDSLEDVINQALSLSSSFLKSPPAVQLATESNGLTSEPAI